MDDRRAMRPGPRLALFGVVLAVLFGTGAAIGAAVGPIEVGTAPVIHEHMDVHTP
jgi:hypothetical protein